MKTRGARLCRTLSYLSRQRPRALYTLTQNQPVQSWAQAAPEAIVCNWITSHAGPLLRSSRGSDEMNQRLKSTLTSLPLLLSRQVVGFNLVVKAQPPALPRYFFPTSHKTGRCTWRGAQTFAPAPATTSEWVGHLVFDLTQVPRAPEPRHRYIQKKKKKPSSSTRLLEKTQDTFVAGVQSNQPPWFVLPPPPAQIHVHFQESSGGNRATKRNQTRYLAIS